MDIVNKIKNNKRLMEIFRFTITGGLSFLVDYGILIALNMWLNVYYLIAAGISFTVSVIVNYFLCVLWAFENCNASNDKKVVTMFVGSSVIGLVINQILMWGFVSIIGIQVLIAKIITTIIVMFWNYVMKKKALVNK